MPSPHSLTAIRDEVARIHAVFNADGGRLWRALEAIQDAPHKVLMPHTLLVAPGEATAISSELLANSTLEPDGIAITHRRRDFVARGEKWRFLKVYDEQNQISYDTPPNRFVRHFLRAVINHLRQLQRQVTRLNGRGCAEVRGELARLLARLRALIDTSTVLAQSAPLLVLPLDDLSLNHDPRYRIVLMAYLDLGVA